MKEARVVDFGGIERKEEVNRVSKLSKLSAYFCGPYHSHITKRAVEGTGNKRRQAHCQVLRKVKTDIEGLRNHEKVNARCQSKSQQGSSNWLTLLQVVTDAKALVKRYKKLVRRWCHAYQGDWFPRAIFDGKMEKVKSWRLLVSFLNLVALISEDYGSVISFIAC
jgi:hypothetical protein